MTEPIKKVECSCPCHAGLSPMLENGIGFSCNHCLTAIDKPAKAMKPSEKIKELAEQMGSLGDSCHAMNCVCFYNSKLISAILKFLDEQALNQLK